jgi:hypothetical protein
LAVDGGAGIGRKLRVGSFNIAASGSPGIISSSAAATLSTSAGTLTLTGDTGVSVNATTGNIVLTPASDVNLQPTSNLVNFGATPRVVVTASATPSIIAGAGIPFTISANQAAANILTLGGGSSRVQCAQTPTASNDIVNKSYVDSVVAGLDVKSSCLVYATTLPAYTAAGTGVGKTLTDNSTFAWLLVDGITFDGSPAEHGVGARILVANGTADAGIYTVTSIGDNSTTPWVLTRATDFDQNSEITSGSFTFIEIGTTYAGNGFVLSTAGPITIDVTVQTWTQFSSTGVYTFQTAGTPGLTIIDSQSGNNVFFRKTNATAITQAQTGALAIDNSTSGVNTINLDMAKFVGAVEFKNDTGNITINPGTGTGNLIVQGSTTNTINLLPSTRTITTTNGNLTITPSSDITFFGTTVSVNNSTSTIASTSALNLTASSGNIALTTSSGVATVTGGGFGTFTITTGASLITLNGSVATTISTSAGNLTLSPFTDITFFGTTVSVNDSTRTIASTGTLDVNAVGVLGLNANSGNLALTASTGIATMTGSGFGTFTLTTGASLITLNGSVATTLSTGAGDLNLSPFTNVVNFGTTLRASALSGNPTLTALSTQSLILASAGSGAVNITPGTNGAVGITTIGTGAISLTSNTSITATAATTVGITATLGAATVTTTNGNINLVTSTAGTSIVLGTSTQLLTITPNSSGNQLISAANALLLSSASGNVIVSPSTNITAFGTNGVTINDSTKTITGVNGTLTLTTSTSGNVHVRPFSNITNFGDTLNNVVITSTATTPSIVGVDAFTLTGTNSLTLSTTATAGGITVAPVSGAPIALTAIGSGGTVTTSSAGLTTIQTTASNSNINLTTNATGRIQVSSGSNVASTSSSTGTLVVTGGSAGLGVAGNIHAGGNINAPTFANGTAGTNVDIRANTTDTTGRVTLLSNRMNIGPNLNTRYVGYYADSGTHGTPASVRPIVTLTLPASSKFYITVDVAVSYGTTVDLFSTKILATSTAGNVTAVVQQFEAITDTSLFTWDVATASTVELRYNVTTAGTVTNALVHYLSASAHDITTIVVNTSV